MSSCRTASVEGAHERDGVIANVGGLVEKARRERVPVVWVQHSNEQLARGSDNGRIRPRADSGRRRVARLVVVGAQTDACIRSTLHGAFVRGYDATLVSDAHMTEDQTAWGRRRRTRSVIAHTIQDAAIRPTPAGRELVADLDLGDVIDGRALLGARAVLVPGRDDVQPRVTSSGATSQHVELHVPLPPDIGPLVTLSFQGTFVEVCGPWKLAVPPAPNDQP